ncbi:MAG: carbohydrate-binding domain-containing protein [Lachnospiraceae bacterium]|nr:carbohydrate-binding domain-containing protein [Lachnospiraceae bacterium]
MTANKNIDKVCIAVILIAVILTILFMAGTVFGIEPVVDMDAESYDGPEYVTANDLNGAWDTSDATLITLNGDSILVDGNGAYVNGSDIVISNGGYYVISGTLDNGRIIVDSFASSKIWIMLDSVNLYCEDDACIRVEEADKVFITLAEGSVNTVSGGVSYSETAIEDGAEAVIFSHDDLTINGSGTLNVNAEYRHGIKANDDFVLAGATVEINSVQDAIHVNEDVAIVNAALTIDAGDDAVSTEGTINIENSDILINKCYEGLEAKYINVYSGNIEIYPSDDGFNASGDEASGFGFGAPGGMGGGPGGFRGTSADADSDNSDLSGNNADPLANKTGNDTITPVNDSGEQDGTASAFAQQDSSSASSQTDSSAPSQDEESEELPYIRIYDGNIRIINEAAMDSDGLDSNGDIYIYGGNIFISLKSSGPSNAIDYGSESGGVCVIDGGTVIACGSSSMAESFDSISTQASIMYTISGGVEAGSTISLETEDGQTLLNAEIPCDFSCAILSCPEMKTGDTYLVTLDDQADDITLQEISSSFGDAQGSGFGGPMNFNDMKDHDSFSQGRSGMRDPGGSSEDSETSGANSERSRGHRKQNSGSLSGDSVQSETDISDTDGSGSTSETGNMAPPDPADMDEMPPGSDGMTPPDFDNMPSDFEGTAPPDFGNMPSGMPGRPGQVTQEETAFTFPGKALSEYSSTTWIEITLSALALAAGLLFAKKYRRR